MARRSHPKKASEPAGSAHRRAGPTDAVSDHPPGGDGGGCAEGAIGNRIQEEAATPPDREVIDLDVEVDLTFHRSVDFEPGRGVDPDEVVEIDLDEELGAHPDRKDPLSLSSEGERATLLASVMRLDAARKEAQAAVPSPGPKPLVPQLLGLAVSTAFAVYVWLGSPAWLAPPPVPLPTLAEEMQDVRAAVWIGTQQVEAYRAQNGRFPGAQEIGPLPPGVRYERLDARSYLVVGQGDRVTVPYSSGEPRDPLLSAVRQVLEGAESQ